MLTTRLTERLGIECPVMSAPMALHSGGRLAAAVSAAGGLGLFGGIHPQGPAWVRQEIGEARSRTDRPFGVGFITSFLPMMRANFEVALAERVPVIALSFGEPAEWAEAAKAAGATVVCQVQTLAAAQEAVEAGADVIVAQGNEAGGHTGTMSLLSLLAGVVQRHPDLPVLAAGGIADGRTLAAVLAAGADGAWVGTAFLATPEAVEVSDAYKQQIVRSDGHDTVYTQVFDIMSGLPWPAGIAERVRRNRFLDEWHGREDELRRRRDELAPALEAARERGDLDVTPVLMGQSAGLVTAVRPAGEVLHGMCEGAAAVLDARARSVVSHG